MGVISPLCISVFASTDACQQACCHFNRRFTLNFSSPLNRSPSLIVSVKDLWFDKGDGFCSPPIISNSLLRSTFLLKFPAFLHVQALTTGGRNFPNSRGKRNRKRSSLVELIYALASCSMTMSTPFHTRLSFTFLNVSLYRWLNVP